ncbi:MAG: N-acetyltransferase family protein [Saprospiraceae bacterium]
MDILIRKTTISDLAAVYGLVEELAIYENAPQELTASLTDYERDFTDGIFESQVALHNGKIIGTIIYYMTYSTWKGRMLYLEDFVITEAYRQKGVGVLLFKAFLQTAKEKGARLTKWQVLDWNEPAIKFYEKHGATLEKEWWNGKIFL